MEKYEGVLASPWDEIAISYVLTCTHVALKRPGEAFKEYSQLVSYVFFYSARALRYFTSWLLDRLFRSFFRFFTENKGWTLPTLFSILRGLRDLAFDVRALVTYDQFDLFTKPETHRQIWMQDLATKRLKLWRKLLVWLPKPSATVWPTGNQKVYVFLLCEFGKIGSRHLRSQGNGAYIMLSGWFWSATSEWVCVSKE